MTGPPTPPTPPCEAELHASYSRTANSVMAVEMVDVPVPRTETRHVCTVLYIHTYSTIRHFSQSQEVKNIIIIIIIIFSKVIASDWRGGSGGTNEMYIRTIQVGHHVETKVED